MSQRTSAAAGQTLASVLGLITTGASRPLVPTHMRSVAGVDLAMFWGCDIQATVALDGDLEGGKDCQHDKITTKVLAAG